MADVAVQTKQGSTSWICDRDAMHIHARSWSTAGSHTASYADVLQYDPNLKPTGKLQDPNFNPTPTSTQPQPNRHGHTTYLPQSKSTDPAQYRLAHICTVNENKEEIKEVDLQSRLAGSVV